MLPIISLGLNCQRPIYWVKRNVFERALVDNDRHFFKDAGYKERCDVRTMFFLHPYPQEMLHCFKKLKPSLFDRK